MSHFRPVLAGKKVRASAVCQCSLALAPCAQVPSQNHHAGTPTVVSFCFPCCCPLGRRGPRAALRHGPPRPGFGLFPRGGHHHSHRGGGGAWACPGGRAQRGCPSRGGHRWPRWGPGALLSLARGPPAAHDRHRGGVWGVARCRGLALAAVLLSLRRLFCVCSASVCMRASVSTNSRAVCSVRVTDQPRTGAGVGPARRAGGRMLCPLLLPARRGPPRARVGHGRLAAGRREAGEREELFPCKWKHSSASRVLRAEPSTLLMAVVAHCTLTYTSFCFGCSSSCEKGRLGAAFTRLLTLNGLVLEPLRSMRLAFRKNVKLFVSETRAFMRVK